MMQNKRVDPIIKVFIMLIESDNIPFLQTRRHRITTVSNGFATRCAFRKYADTGR